MHHELILYRYAGLAACTVKEPATLEAEFRLIPDGLPFDWCGDPCNVTMEKCC